MSSPRRPARWFECGSCSIPPSPPGPRRASRRLCGLLGVCESTRPPWPLAPPRRALVRVSTFYTHTAARCTCTVEAAAGWREPGDVARFANLRIHTQETHLFSARSLIIVHLPTPALKSCLQRPAFENGQLPAAPRPRSNRQHKDAQLGRPGVHVPHTTPSASVRVARNPRLGGSRRRRPPPANPPLQCSPSRGPGGWASPSVHLGHLLRLRRVLQALGISRYLSASLGTLAISRYSRHLSAFLGISRRFSLLLHCF